MKRIAFAFLLFAAMIFMACETTETVADNETQPVAQNVPAPAEPKTAPVKADSTQEEYMRSISGLGSGAVVSREDFEADKQKVLAIIEKLADVMKVYDYDGWLTYIAPESVEYWQNGRNLASASRMLPASVRAQIPNQRLRNLHDYFVYVFVPSRQDRTVDEIRYISPTDVKAVQVTAETDFVYYYFTKVDGKWLVHLPPVES